MEHREEVHDKMQRRVRNFLGLSTDRGRKKWRSSSIERPRKGRDLQRESQMKEQAVRIVSTRRVESLLQSTVTWAKLSEKKKEQ